MAGTRWIAERTEPGVVHVRPRDELVPNDDGPDGWLVVHNSLDNREANEPAEEAA